MITVGIDEKKIDAIFSSVNQCQLPGAAVGIALNGRPVYRKGFGLAHLELPVMLSPSMRMRIYSTTKHFTCLAFLLLCEEGKASPEDTLGDHLPELHPITRGVTLRQLMGNTGGLRDAHDLTWQFSGTGRPVSSADLLSFYRNIPDINFPPGTTWCYGNGGFLLLTEVIERITRKSLEQVLRERIFEPIGMHDSLLRRLDTDFVPNSATMHMNDGRGGFNRDYVGTALAGEAGMVSTVDDMLRWLAHMANPTVGTADTWRQMMRSQVLRNGFETGYSFGLMLGRYRGVDVIHHAGGGQGANSQMLRVPSLGLDIVVLVNRYDVAAVLLTNEILDACVSGLAPRAPTTHLDESAEGVYRSPKTGRLLQLLSSKGNQPWIEDGCPIALLDGYEVPLEVETAGVFRTAPLYDHMKLKLRLQGSAQRPDAVELTDFGTSDRLNRLERVGAREAEPIRGQYYSASTKSRLVIERTDDGWRLHSVGRFGSAEFTLEPLAQHLWRARSTTPMSWGGVLEFSADGQGMQYTSLRTRALPFERVA